MKYFSCLTIVLSLVLALSLQDGQARTKKNPKKSSSISRSSKKNKSKKGKIKKTSRYKRVKKSGNGPDLKALTTVSPYTENPANGVNSIETKPGL